MELQTVVLTLGSVLLGVSVAPLTTWLNHVVLERRQRRERDAQEVRGRSEQAAGECFADLAQVEVAIPAYVRSLTGRRTEGTAELDSAREAVDVSLGALEAHTVVLAPPYRAPMRRVVEVLRVASDLGRGTGLAGAGGTRTQRT